jgi:hypothetical protein
MFKRSRGRRPSAPLVISSIALFFSLGGAGYAAFQLPRNSVGTHQLRNNSVTWQKIRPGTIGSARIDQAMVQTRVTGTCFGANGAIGAVLQSGDVTCNPTLPKEFGSSSGATPVLTTSSTAVASRPLTSGTYLLMAVGYVTTSKASTVDCTLAVPGGTSQTRSLATSGAGQFALPINLASTVPTTGATATLNCNQVAPGTATDTVAGQINALQTASNG